MNDKTPQIPHASVNVATTQEPSTGATGALNHESIVMALQKTPTGGNSKPFTWEWINEATLVVRHLEEYDNHYLNRNKHTSWITLGCLIESVHVAAGFQNYAIQTTIDSAGPQATIVFVPSQSSIGDEKTFSSLLTRKTFRGLFTPSVAPSLNPGEFGFEPLHGVQVHVAAEARLLTSFTKFIEAADSYLWLQSKATLSFFKEIRFFDHREEPRGIRSEDLGVGRLDQLMLFIFSFVPRLLNLFVRVPGLNATFRKASKRSLRNSHFVLITATASGHAHLVEAGRLSMRCWIQLERQGYQAQPYSMASVTLLDAKAGCLPADTSKYFRRLFSVTGPEVVAKQFDLSATEQPVWLLRVGKNK